MPRQRKKLLIVDGYNVLRSGSRYQRIDDPDYTDDWFNTARDALVNDVINFAGREWRAIVVFDGGGNAFSAGEATSLGGVRIVFSPAGQSADKVIEKLAHDARAPVETLVVSATRHPGHRLRIRRRPHERGGLLPRARRPHEDARLDVIRPRSPVQEHCRRPRRRLSPSSPGCATAVKRVEVVRDGSASRRRLRGCVR